MGKVRYLKRCALGGGGPPLFNSPLLHHLRTPEDSPKDDIALLTFQKCLVGLEIRLSH